MPFSWLVISTLRERPSETVAIPRTRGICQGEHLKPVYPIVLGVLTSFLTAGRDARRMEGIIVDSGRVYQCEIVWLLSMVRGIPEA